MLIEKGADVNATNKFWMSPLHFAAQNGTKKIASLLIKKGANINLQDKTGDTPLAIAIYYGTL